MEAPGSCMLPTIYIYILFSLVFLLFSRKWSQRWTSSLRPIFINRRDTKLELWFRRIQLIRALVFPSDRPSAPRDAVFRYVCRSIAVFRLEKRREKRERRLKKKKKREKKNRKHTRRNGCRPPPPTPSRANLDYDFVTKWERNENKTKKKKEIRTEKEIERK